MAYVTIYQNAELKTKRQPLSRQCRIGRKPENELALSDRTVSRQHAEINFDDQARCWQIENLSDKNPVRINGKEMRKTQILFDGDRIGIGNYVLEFCNCTDPNSHHSHD